MDQYIGLEPGWLFDESSEHAVIDPDNLLIELAHIRAAAAELPPLPVFVTPAENKPQTAVTAGSGSVSDSPAKHPHPAF